MAATALDVIPLRRVVACVDEVGAAFAVGLGILLGVRCAVAPEATSSRVFMAASLLGASLPTFLIGILLILALSVGAGWFPSYGRGEVVSVGWWRSGLLTTDGWRHALLPAITVIGLEFTFLIGGLVVTEQVFNLNGIGQLFVQSVARNDFTLIQGMVMLIAAFYVFVNLVVDLLYAVFDPRIRYA